MLVTTRFISPRGAVKNEILRRKRWFQFSIVNFPFICSNIPAAPAYGVYISQLIQYSRACGSYKDFLDRGLLLTRKLQNQGFLLVKLKSSLRKFYGRTMTVLTVMECLCHKWPRICSPCHKHFPVLSSFMTYHVVCNYIHTTGSTSGAGTAYPSGALEFTPVISGARVTRSLVLYVCFVDRCLSFCIFFGHCVVCSSSIYGLWLPLNYFISTIYLYIYKE